MTDDGALFDVPPPAKSGRVEAGTRRAIEAAWKRGGLVEEDWGMIEGALLASRTLDRAESLPDKSAVYAVAQLMRPWQDAMHALRLPAEVAPLAAPELPAGSHTDTPSWLGDTFGTPSD